MIAEAIAVSISWKVAVLGMAMYKRHLNQKEWPHVAERPVRNPIPQLERRVARVQVVHYEGGNTRIEVQSC